MKLKDLKENWEALGEEDPYWAVLSDPTKINNKWDLDVFYRTGEELLVNVVDKFSTEFGIKFGKVLDFGCGPGRITQALARRSSSVVGVDISSTMIEKAIAYNKFPTKCSYKVNSTDALPDFADNSFDLVFSYITLQHIEPKFALNYIKDFIRIAKPGGHILFNLPTEPPVFFKILRTLVGNTGLNLIRRQYYGKSSVIEMHAIKKEVILNLAKEKNAPVIAMKPDDRLGMKWKSNFYLLRKM